MSKKSRNKLRVCSLILLMAILFGCFPTTVFAVSDEENITDTSTMPDDEIEMTTDSNEVISDDVIGNVSEVIHMRTENVKHFQLADGTYKAVTYTYPVHRLDENGSWIDINNTLSLAQVGSEAKYSTSDGRIQFAERFAANRELFSFYENGYNISMQWLESGTNNSEQTNTNQNVNLPQITNSPLRPQNNAFSTIEEAIAMNSIGKILYSNVRSGIDLEYVLQSNNIKENIIVKNRASSYQYAFQLGLSGLTAELTAFGEVELKDATNGTVQYIIPAPYMYDSAGNHSQEVSCQLAQISSGRYLLLITANDEWINADERVFPVTVDPTVIQRHIVVDTYVDYTLPDINYGESINLYIKSVYAQDLNAYRDIYATYIRAEMPELPSGAFISAARFHVEYYIDNPTASMTIGAYQLNETWSEVVITANTAPQPGNFLSSLSLSGGSASNRAVANFIVTDAVRAWYNAGTLNSPGFVFKALDNPHNATAVFKAYQYNSIHSYYEIDYTYTVPDGVYALRNHHLTNNWMKFFGPTVVPGATLQHGTYTTSPVESFDRSALVKISQKGTTGRYVIRSMYNNCLGLGYSNGNMVTVSIPAQDESVPDMYTYKIEWDGEGFTISPYNDSTVLTLTADSTNIKMIAKGTNNSNNNRYRWDFVQYTGAHRSGVTISRGSSWSANGIILGTKAIIGISASWSTYIKDNSAKFQYSTESNPMYFLEQEDNGGNPLEEHQRFLIASRLGSCTIRVNIIRYTLLGQDAGVPQYLETISTAHSFQYQIVPAEGEYMIQSALTGNYINIENSSHAEGALIEEWEYNEQSYQKWNITHAGKRGYLYIQSADSQLYLAVDPLNTSVVKQTATQDIYSKWKIEASENGAVMLANFVSMSHCLSIANVGGGVNGTNLVQSTYSTDNPYGKWYVCREIRHLDHFYDSTFAGDPTLISYIPTATEFADFVYKKYFGTQIFHNNMSAYASTADSADCVSGSNAPCVYPACGEHCGNHHHKHLTNIRETFVGDYTPNLNYIGILWCNRPPNIYCNGPGTHELQSDSNYIIAQMDNNKSHIIFYTIGEFDSEAQPDVQQQQREEQLACMALNLVHELAHCWENRDVYNNPGHDSQNDNCLMKRYSYTDGQAYQFYLDILNHEDDPFCESCMKEFAKTIL